MIIIKKIKLRQKSELNLISYFIELFFISTIFKSAISDSNIANYIIQTFPILNKTSLLFVCLILLVTSTVIRVGYAEKLNRQFEKDDSKNNIDKNSIDSKARSYLNNKDKKIDRNCSIETIVKLQPETNEILTKDFIRKEDVCDNEYVNFNKTECQYFTDLTGDDNSNDCENNCKMLIKELRRKNN